MEPIARPEDLSFDLARDAYRWNSFDPERRARSCQQEYADDVNRLHAEMSARCRTDAQREVMAREIERYRLGYLDRYRAVLHSRSRTASPMVTGPSNFPAARNAKRLDIEHRRVEEFLAWRERARAAIVRAIDDARTDGQKADDRWDRLRRDFAGSLGTIEGIDAGDRGWTRSAFVNAIAGKVERLALAGDVDLVARSLDMVSQYNAEHKKPAISPRHKFWTFGELAERSRAAHAATADAEPETVHDGDGFMILRNPALDRVQIMFHGKPSADLRVRLRDAGWHWSPREMAWQRKLTEVTVHSARRIMGVSS